MSRQPARQSMVPPIMRRRLSFLRVPGSDGAVASTQLTDLQFLASFTLLFGCPVVWFALVLLTWDRLGVLAVHKWFMPVIGLASSTMTNGVPVGSGAIYLPVMKYYELGVFSAAIFGSATQAVGSGIFGFLVWFARDPALIRFETMYFTVLPAWGGWMLGFWDGEKKDFMFVQVGSGRVVRNIVRSIFAFFAASVGTFTLLAWRRGSIDAMIAARASKQTAGVPPPPPPDHGSAVVYVPPDRGGGTAGGRHRDGAPPAALTWTFVSLLAFVVGWVLVANIGMGNSAATFISCTTLLVEDTRTCIVTAIVAGGWTSILPTLCHAFVFDDLPLALLLFVTPGLWLGSFLGPLLSEDLGERSLLLLVSMFMLAAALAMAVEVLVDTAPFTPGYREHRAPPSSEYGT